jgi:FAD/FMN-containing dehydrogenase
VHPSFIESLKSLLGEPGTLVTAADQAPYLHDWRGRYHGEALAVARPATTAELVSVVCLCNRFQIPMIPQGGNTGLCGAAIPLAGQPSQLLVNLGRMNQVRQTDWDNNTLTVEAGVTLQQVQELAESHGCRFGVDLASNGTAQIGGMISTNAGGVQVLRYGNMRAQVLGLEVVLPDGRLLDLARGLRKDNTGYDLKQLFIGAEGTLGFVSAAVLKLVPLPRARSTLWLGLESPQQALNALHHLQVAFHEGVSSFELISEPALKLLFNHFPAARNPLPQLCPWQVIAEVETHQNHAELQEQVLHSLQNWVDENAVLDAVMATSERERLDLWALRENLSEAQKREGFSIKHDISVPVSAIPNFIETTGALVQKRFPQARVVCFGHMGDGNLHYNLSLPEGDNMAFVTHPEFINRLVYDQVMALGGSISAEHGIGQLKREELVRVKDPVEIALMQSLKQTLDPLGLMNPGKVLATNQAL